MTLKVLIDLLDESKKIRSGNLSVELGKTENKYPDDFTSEQEQASNSQEEDNLNQINL